MVSDFSRKETNFYLGLIEDWSIFIFSLLVVFLIVGWLLLLASKLVFVLMGAKTVSLFLVYWDYSYEGS
jgi:hypothetical protein